MKLVIVLFVTLVAVAYANECVHNNADLCTVMCPAGERKACEKGVCTCSRICTLANDCDACPTHTDPMGHVHHEQAHCIDGACACSPDGPGPAVVGPGGR
ncbi:hypothetical protein ACF0H5_013021 [Mactra antiquata]